MDKEKQMKSAAAIVKKRYARSKKTKKAITEEQKEFRLKLTPEMLMVKEFYHSMKLSGEDIQPHEAAVQCDIAPSAIENWFDDPDVKSWFMTPPIKFKAAMKAVTLMALRKGRDLLSSGPPDIQEKAMRYFIDQSLGKAKDKQGDFDEEDEDESLMDDIKELEKLEAKFKGEADENTGKDAGNSKNREGPTGQTVKASPRTDNPDDGKVELAKSLSGDGSILREGAGEGKRSKKESGPKSKGGNKC